MYYFYLLCTQNISVTSLLYCRKMYSSKRGSISRAPAASRGSPATGECPIPRRSFPLATRPSTALLTWREAMAPARVRLLGAAFCSRLTPPRLCCLSGKAHDSSLSPSDREPPLRNSLRKHRCRGCRRCASNSPLVFSTPFFIQQVESR